MEKKKTSFSEKFTLRGEQIGREDTSAFVSRVDFLEVNEGMNSMGTKERY